MSKTGGLDLQHLDSKLLKKEVNVSILTMYMSYVISVQSLNGVEWKLLEFKITQTS